MKLWWRINLAVAGLAGVWLTGLALAAQGQTLAPGAGQKAGAAFKNVTTSTLKELSVDDFIASMGLISANLGLDCADCHPNAGTDKADFVTDTPRKITARRMVEMVAGINRSNFNGVQRVTCFEGATGSQEPCRSASTATQADYTTTRPLAVGEQLTIVTALAKGTVSAPAPIIERNTGDLATFFDPQPAFLGLAIFVLIAGLAFVFYLWYDRGRDRRERETIVPEYEPPDALRPAQLGLLLDESADTKDVTATIVDLAVRGFLTITEEPTTGIFAKQDWTLRATGSASPRRISSPTAITRPRSR